MNRFEKIQLEPDTDLEFRRRGMVAVCKDGARNFSRTTAKPSLPATTARMSASHASLNPYRGCEHGCIYCYARPTHEFLGFSAGLDFESKIMVKEDAPELLRAELMSPKWQPQVIFMSGVTDCYQPVEEN